MDKRLAALEFVLSSCEQDDEHDESTTTWAINEILRMRAVSSRRARQLRNVIEKNGPSSYYREILRLHREFMIESRRVLERQDVSQDLIAWTNWPPAKYSR